MFDVLMNGKYGSTNVPLKVNASGELITSGQNYKVEPIIIATQNVIPALSFSPNTGAVTVVAANGNTTPGIDWTISENTITWKPGVAGYNLDPGDWVVITYMYSS